MIADVVTKQTWADGIGCWEKLGVLVRAQSGSRYGVNSWGLDRTRITITLGGEALIVKYLNKQP